MTEQLKRGELFSPELVNEVFSLVNGKSSLVRLSKQTPIAFNGTQLFTFNFDNEVDIVAEGGAKSHGGVSYAAVKMVPVKVEYGARVTDEFIYGSKEYKLNVMEDFKKGFAKKLGKAIDIMAIHGINPRSGEESAVIGTNAFAKKVTQKVTYDAQTPDANVEAGIDKIVEADVDAEITGLIASNHFSRALSKEKDGNTLKHPELAWAGAPDKVKGLDYDVNSTLTFKDKKVQAIVGDFENAFRWGFAKDVTFETIEYGDPDNTDRDLKGHNEVYLRAEAYIGWGILKPNAFAIVEGDIA